ncbi:hypothetical protein G7Y89_g2857 [Cudoniella acicularis]|uniref:Uncharacterized protein n=1 Tax=Cudoniella acicularis TaxID=354080 RepID=A0A8H4RTQ2_9HELO|nr:hypothetical protein G7Y89_g2857 [Cudoniella acicularis]
MSISIYSAAKALSYRTRILLKDNAYVGEVLPLVDSDRATNLIATALTCSYYKEYLSEGTMALLQQNAPDAAKMLMIHHAIINPEMHKASLVIAAHSIWLMAIFPLTEKYRFQTYDYSWVGYGEENYLSKVHGIVGTSRKMLYFQQLITEASKFPNAFNHENLLSQITESQQWVDLTEERMPRRIALKTAETYRLATQLYALVRLYR